MDRSIPHLASTVGSVLCAYAAQGKLFSSIDLTSFFNLRQASLGETLTDTFGPFAPSSIVKIHMQKVLVPAGHDLVLYHIEMDFRPLQNIMQHGLHGVSTSQVR